VGASAREPRQPRPGNDHSNKLAIKTEILNSKSVIKRLQRLRVSGLRVVLERGAARMLMSGDSLLDFDALSFLEDRLNRLKPLVVGAIAERRQAVLRVL
jgi:hypothetical protein